ncbi:MAG TPA: hypothetical protein DCM08_03585 [Microscillaceae bacterium]|jgi:hypothetical protein|nr:hypothetical protein [Microscillaceae bacterium]
MRRHINIIGGLLALLFSCFLGSFGLAQEVTKETIDNPKKINVYAGFFSNYGHLGFTVEQVLPLQKTAKLSSRSAFLWSVGLAYRQMSIDFRGTSTFSTYILAIGAGWLVSSKKLRSHGDFGFGFKAFSIPERELGIQAFDAVSYTQIYQLNFRMGYRFQRPSGGFFFKIGLQIPLLWHEANNMANPAYWQVSVTENIVDAFQNGNRSNGGVFFPDLGIGWTFKHIKRK